MATVFRTPSGTMMCAFRRLGSTYSRCIVRTVSMYCPTTDSSDRPVPEAVGFPRFRGHAV